MSRPARDTIVQAWVSVEERMALDAACTQLGWDLATLIRQAPGLVTAVVRLRGEKRALEEELAEAKARAGVTDDPETTPSATAASPAPPQNA